MSTMDLGPGATCGVDGCVRHASCSGKPVVVVIEKATEVEKVELPASGESPTIVEAAYGREIGSRPDPE